MEQKEEVYIIVSALNEAIRIQNIKIASVGGVPRFRALYRSGHLLRFFGGFFNQTDVGVFAGIIIFQ